MNYLPFAGAWFYGAANAQEIASFYSSWGLIGAAPDLTGTFLAYLCSSMRPVPLVSI